MTTLDDAKAMFADKTRDELIEFCAQLTLCLQASERDRRASFAAIESASRSMEFAARREVTEADRRKVHAIVRNHLNEVVAAGHTEIDVLAIMRGQS